MIDESSSNFSAALCPALYRAYYVLGGKSSSARDEQPSETLRARSEERQRQFRILFNEAEKSENFFSSTRLGCLVDGGTEHEVYQAQDKPGWLYKVTFPHYTGFTHRALKLHGGGLKVMEDDALPTEYIYRWMLHNEVFGDDTEYMGVFQTEGSCRLVMAQREIEGCYPDAEQVHGYLYDQLSFIPTGDGRWLRRSDEDAWPLALADTKPANFIFTPQGQVHAIDVVLFEPSLAILNEWEGG